VAKLHRPPNRWEMPSQAIVCMPFAYFANSFSSYFRVHWKNFHICLCHRGRRSKFSA